jgi:hypothetical protein
MSTSPFFLLSAATTNLTQVTTGYGNLAGGYVLNTNAAARYIKFYSNPPAPANGPPVVGTTVPWLTVLLAPSVGTNLSTLMPGFDSVAASGPVWFATTANAVYTDTTAVGAGDLYITIFKQG